MKFNIKKGVYRKSTSPIRRRKQAVLQQLKETPDIVRVFCVYCRGDLLDNINLEQQAHINCFEAVNGFAPSVDLKERINILLQNLDMISEDDWDELEHFEGVKVIWFIDRQKPSVEADYTFDEERFGITNDGRYVWGFDSGCSCPAPWIENDDCYSHAREWKEFVVDAPSFDEDWEIEAQGNVALILSKAGLM